MYIVTSKQMYAAESNAVKRGTTFSELMERAGYACAKIIYDIYCNEKAKTKEKEANQSTSKDVALAKYSLSKSHELINSIIGSFELRTKFLLVVSSLNPSSHIKTRIF